MKEFTKLTSRRRKKFIRQFQRYLNNYLKHPGFRSRYLQSGREG